MSIENIKIKDFLGYGVYSLVFSGYYKDNKEEVAIKFTNIIDDNECRVYSHIKTLNTDLSRGSYASIFILA